LNAISASKEVKLDHIPQVEAVSSKEIQLFGHFKMFSYMCVHVQEKGLENLHIPDVNKKLQAMKNSQ